MLLPMENMPQQPQYYQPVSQGGPLPPGQPVMAHSAPTPAPGVQPGMPVVPQVQQPVSALTPAPGAPAPTPAPDNGRRKGSPLATVCSVVGTVVLAAAIALCLAVAVPRLFGLTSYTVVSGSMEPAIPTGSLVYVGAVDPAQVQPGQVIAFTGTVGGESMVTGGTEVVIVHRVVQNDTAECEFITKGDANAEQDLAPVPYIAVIGEVTFSVPVLGNAVLLLATTAGKVVFALVVTAALVLCFAADRLRRSAQG